MKSIKLDFKPLIHRLDILTNKFVESEFSGEIRSHQKRKGIEFEDFKEFRPGDDASLIDWKASLRSNQLLYRQYTQLKALNIFLLLDVSNSMLFSSINKLKCEYAAELAASLSYYFLKSDDMVSLTLMNEHMVKHIPPNLGSNQFAVITRTLGDPQLYGGGFSITKTISFLQGSLRQGAVVILISDFLGLEKDWHKPLHALASRADILALIVRDPQDMHLNQRIGHAILEDPFSDDILFVDVDRIQDEYGRQALRQLDEVRALLGKGGIDSLVLPTDKSFVESIVKFFSRKRWL